MGNSPHSLLSKMNVELHGYQLLWCQQMEARYQLQSIDAVIQALYAHCEHGDHRFIFGKIRCNSCGRKFAKKTIVVCFSSEQINFLQNMMTMYQIPDRSKVVRVMIDYAQEGRQLRRSSDAAKAAVIMALERAIFVDPCTSTSAASAAAAVAVPSVTQTGANIASNDPLANSLQSLSLSASPSPPSSSALSDDQIVGSSTNDSSDIRTVSSMPASVAQTSAPTSEPGIEPP